MVFWSNVDVNSNFENSNVGGNSNAGVKNNEKYKKWKNIKGKIHTQKNKEKQEKQNKRTTTKTQNQSRKKRRKKRKKRKQIQTSKQNGHKPMRQQQQANIKHQWDNQKIYIYI